MHVIYSESEEAGASSASVLGTPMIVNFSGKIESVINHITVIHGKTYRHHPKSRLLLCSE